jgi:O-antigen ligase
MVLTWQTARPWPWITCGLSFAGVIIPLVLSQSHPAWLAVAGVAAAAGSLVVAQSPKRALVLYVALIPFFMVWAARLVGNNTGGAPFSSAEAIKDVLLVMLLVGWGMSLAMRPRPVRIPYALWVGAFQGLALVMVLRSPSWAIGLLAFRNVFEFFMLYVLAADLWRTDAQRVDLLKIMLISGIVVQAYGLWIWLVQSTSISITADGHILGRLTAFGDFTSSGPYATYATLLLIVGMAFWGSPRLIGRFRPLLWVSLALTVVSVVLAFERRGWLGALVAMVLVSVLSRKFRVAGSILLALSVGTAVILVIQPDLIDLMLSRVQESTGRSEIWAGYIARVLASPFLGEGLGAAGNAVRAIGTQGLFTPHNYFLLLLVQGGVPLLTLFSLVVIVVMRRGLGRLARNGPPACQLVGVVALAALATLLTQALISDLLETFPFNAYFWLFAGLGAAKD